MLESHYFPMEYYLSNLRHINPRFLRATPDSSSRYPVDATSLVSLHVTKLSEAEVVPVNSVHLFGKS